jgi:SAM-dependent methyltransferase
MDFLPEDQHAAEEKITSKIQALFRGKHSRGIHVKRKQDGAAMVCPFVASSTDISNKICTLADISKEDIFLDLGCGDGTALVSVALQTGAQCIGYEIDPLLCATARRKLAEAGLTSATVHEQDICSADYSSASVIYIFLVPSCMKALSPILRSQAAPGTRIISYHFPLPEEDGWVPDKTMQTDDVVNRLNSNSRKILFMYVIPCPPLPENKYCTTHNA